MTSKYLRPAIAMAIALCLAGCGGTATFDIKGTVFGLSDDGLVLKTNGQTVAVPKVNADGATTTFKFGKPLSYGEVYAVSVDKQPPHQTCTPGSYSDPATLQFYNGPSDTAGRLAAINIGVSCAWDSFMIGGTITGLTSDGLKLINGSTDVITPAANAADFTFGLAVPYKSTYGVSVLTQPADNVCSVTNGTGTMLLDRSADATVPKIANIVVTCVPKPSTP